MIASSTEAVNLALQRIGAAPITSLTANTDEENRKVAARAYGPALDEILREGAWNHAIKRESLPRDTTAPAFEWSYRFALPSDYIFLLECNGFDAHLYQQEKFQIENGYILTDSLTAKVRYVYRNENAPSWPSDFVKCFTLLLAARMASPIMGNAQMGAMLEAEYKMEVKKALQNSANESRTNRESWIVESDLVRARYGSCSDFRSVT